ncbi:MAG: hypothetical protein MZV63_21480 [Marinilabiliales bacterium]|nr:hypothetical protein [Marinilabiliales bacterium]
MMGTTSYTTFADSLLHRRQMMPAASYGAMIYWLQGMNLENLINQICRKQRTGPWPVSVYAIEGLSPGTR